MSIRITPAGDVVFDTVEEALAYQATKTAITTTAVVSKRVETPKAAALDIEAAIRRQVPLPPRALKSVSDPVLPLSRVHIPIIEAMRLIPEAAPGGEGVTSAELSVLLDINEKVMSGHLSRSKNKAKYRPVERIAGHNRWRLTSLGAVGRIVERARPALYTEERAS